MNIINPSFRNKITEGNNKIIYQDGPKGQFDLFFKDDNSIESDLDVSKCKKIMSEKLFELLSECGIKNHFLSSIGLKEHRVLALDMLPITFSVYAFITKSLSQRFYLPIDMKFEEYLLEIHTNNNYESILSPDHILKFNWLSYDDVKYLTNQSIRIMDIIYSYFKALNMTVISLHLRYGKRYKNDGDDYDLILGDDLTLKNIELKFNDLSSCHRAQSYLKITERMMNCSKF